LLVYIYAHIYVSNRDARIYLHNFKSSLLILTILYCIYIQAANMLTCKILQTVLERKLEKLIFSELPEKQKKNVETYVTLISMQRQLGKTSNISKYSGYRLDANKNNNNFSNVNNT